LDLDPSRFDHQTAEIFLARLNRVLELPETTVLEKSLDQIRLLRAQRDNAVTALRSAWAYVHQRFQGLKCGAQGTWAQAYDEITTHIGELQATVANLKSRRDGVGLKMTDRAEWLELVPSLVERIKRLEDVVFPPVEQGL
jgi:hypothetical protein